MKIDLLNSKEILKTHPFTVEEINLKVEGKELSHPYHRLICPDWVNILPITKDGEAILILQPRAGIAKESVEIPGGVVDEGEKPLVAAARELEEETGYISDKIVPLLSMHPNPAFIDNQIHFFIAHDCRLNPNRKHFPDRDEHIIVEKISTSDLENAINSGKITPCLASLCIHLGLKHL